MVDTSKPSASPSKPATPSKPAQGSVDPKEYPPTPPTPTPAPPPPATPSGMVTITHAPPLPEQSARGVEQKPVLESSDAEQAAGKSAMDTFKRRQAEEEEAGRLAVQRHASVRGSVRERDPEEDDTEEHERRGSAHKS